MQQHHSSTSNGSKGSSTTRLHFTHSHAHTHAHTQQQQQKPNNIHPAIQLLLKAHKILNESPDFASSKVARSSHNELERGRRAHLRTCMDELKTQLNRITPGTRLTTLVILKAAKEQLHLNRMKHHHLKRLQERREKDYQEAMDGYRRVLLQVQKLKQLLRRKRCSGSECSIATTVSEESDVHNNLCSANKRAADILPGVKSVHQLQQQRPRSHLPHRHKDQLTSLVNCEQSLQLDTV